MTREVDIDRFKFDNTYADQLEGFHAPCKGDQAPGPKLVRLNSPLAEKLGLHLDGLLPDELAAILAGSVTPKGAAPLAQVYAGHQFGGFSSQLGDGRALLLGEVMDRDENRRDIHLKGSGPTPFSRGGDGKAALGPVLREYLIAEAMHSLNVPTTRALGAVTTGETISRDTPQPGAVLARVASSHLRVGTFQFFAARGETAKVQQLADYAIARHFPELTGQEDCYLDLLCAVRDRQAETLAGWMLVGFVHGVMNTDNTTISGETIDFGPCAFLDSYDPGAVFSSIDTNGRYAYGNQPVIARWNLARFAETLVPLISTGPLTSKGGDIDQVIATVTEEINVFANSYLDVWLQGMRSKLGLFTRQDTDLELANQLYTAMNEQNVDFTLFFRKLADAVTGDPANLRTMFDEPDLFDDWYDTWQTRLMAEATPLNVRMAAMNKVNPIYVPRNHKVEEALQAAVEKADYSKFDKLMTVLAAPFEEREGLEDYAAPAPADFGPYKTFCGT